MKKILLIGGAGFIGHHLALKLKAIGYDVYIVDSCTVNNLIQHQSNVRYRKFIIQRLDLLREANILVFYNDAREYHNLSQTFGSIKPDIVIHLAAVAHANVANKDPYSTFDHSLRTLENTLDACHSFAERVIYFSSSMVYGDFEKDFVTEESETKPKGIYGALKLSGELMVKAYSQVKDLSYTIIRPSALYGERCVSRRVLQIFIEEAQKKNSLKVYGDEKLDFTYIADLVEGIELVVEKKESHNETFNMTYGKAQSVKCAAKMISQNFNVPIIYHPHVENGLKPKRGTLDVTKARELLGYKPEYDLKKGLIKYINWYRSK